MTTTANMTITTTTTTTTTDVYNNYNYFDDYDYYDDYDDDDTVTMKTMIKKCMKEGVGKLVGLFCHYTKGFSAHILPYIVLFSRD